MNKFLMSFVLAFTILAPLQKVYAVTSDILEYDVSTVDDHGRLLAKVIGFKSGLDHYPSTLTIPDYITYQGQECPVIAIEDNAFRYSGFTSINLGNNLQWIGEYAFEGISVNNLVLPASLTKVYQKGLPHCKELYIEDSEESISFIIIGINGFARDFNLDNVEKLYMGRNINADFSFSLKSVSDLTIGDKVTNLNDGLFNGADKLTLVKLPPKLEVIGENTFYEVPITLIEIPASVREICAGAFGKTKINSVKFSGDKDAERLIVSDWAFPNVSIAGMEIDRNIAVKSHFTNGDWLASSKASLQNVEFGNNVTEVPNAMFKDCYRLGNVTLGSNIKTIDGDAFNGCTALCSITLPESMETIGGGAFYNCTSLDKINLPDGISNIGSGAFSGCTSLTEVHILAKLSTLSRYTFEGCTSLRSVDFGGSVKLIEENVFAGCSSLVSVSLPEGLERIQSNAFTGCTSLAKVEFPSTFKTFQCSTDNVPFKECNAIREVICHGSVPAELGYGSSGLPFEDEVYKNATLFVPDEAIDAYKSAECWQPFYKITEVDGIAAASNALTVRGDRIVSATGEAFTVTIVGADGTVLYVGPATETPTLSPGLYLAAPEGSPCGKFVVR